MNDMLERSLHGVAIYNPRLLSKEELIGFFVARQVELERIVEALRRESRAQPQHHLVVGARGMGKTTLLNRLRYAIEDDEELGSRCLGLVFPEEQYNVVCLADFWLNCVDALADGLESAGQTELVEGLDEEIGRIQALPRKDDRGRQALKLLCRLSDRLDRRLVLLVDNVDLVLDRLEDEQWALREVLSSEERIQLVGATSAPLESNYRHDKAFYDFFRVHHLEGLSDEETFTVLRRLADATGHDRVARLLEDEPGRVRTVRLMAGGNPRTVVMLFSVLAQGTDGDVRTDIERLLDQSTPLYKHRLEALPTQAQQVLDALAKHWAPATATEIATATHLQVNVVSAQLDRLVRDGTVEKVSLPDTKRQGFQISERFFNIWCLMRASRRVRRRLIWLVEFLRLMFGTEELTQRARRHLALEQPRDGIRHAELGLALADLMEDGPLRTALETRSIRTLCADPDARLHLIELLDLDDHDFRLETAAERLTLLAEAREAVVTAGVNLPDWDPESFWNLLAGVNHLSVQFKHRIATAIEGLDNTKIAALRSRLQHDQLMWEGGLIPEESASLSRAIREGDIDISDLTWTDLAAAALSSGDRSIIPCALAALYYTGVPIDHYWPLLKQEIFHSKSLVPWLLWASLSLERDVSKEETAELVLAISASRQWGPLGLNHLANFFQDIGRFSEAEATYRNVISHELRTGIPWFNLGTLLERMNRRDEAVSAYRNAVHVMPSLASGWYRLARLLYARRVNLAAAADAAKRAVSVAKTPPHMIMLATIQAARGDWREAEACIHRFITSADQSNLTEHWRDTLCFFWESVEKGFVSEARGVLAATGTTEQWKPLDHALRMIEHWDVKALGRFAPEMREAIRLVLAHISPRLLEEQTS